MFHIDVIISPYRDYKFYTHPSVCPSTMFSGLFSAMCAAIALKLHTWFYIYALQIKFKDGCYWPIFGRAMPLELSHLIDFTVFPGFFPQCVQLLHWNFVHGFISMTYRSASKMVANDQYLEELCPLERSHFKGFYSLLDFFPQYVHLLHWNFVHGIISMTCTSSSKMVVINQFFFQLNIRWLEPMLEHVYHHFIIAMLLITFTWIFIHLMLRVK
jgi:hypothetical protein